MSIGPKTTLEQVTVLLFITTVECLAKLVAMRRRVLESRLRGFSITELMIAVTLLSLLILLSYAFLSQSHRLFRRVNASGDADRGLRKAARALRADLINTGRLGVASVANGINGDAIWFLSAQDPASREFVRKSTGRPFWQKNILYYLAVPEDHDQRFHMSCVAQERVCSHKILIKLVIDHGHPTTPDSSEADEEQLIPSSEIQTYLSSPPSLDLSSLTADPRVLSAEYVAGSLLDCEVEILSGGREIHCLLTAGLIEDARKNFPLGKVPFPDRSFTLSRMVGILPSN